MKNLKVAYILIIFFIMLFGGALSIMLSFGVNDIPDTWRYIGIGLMFTAMFTMIISFLISEKGLDYKPFYNIIK